MTNHTNGFEPLADYDNPRNRRAIVREDCKGPNAACRAAHRAGRPVHIIPPQLDPAINEGLSSLVMPTYHFATVSDAHNAVAEVFYDAPVVRCDDDLIKFRDEGVAHWLPEGWVDPTRR